MIRLFLFLIIFSFSLMISNGVSALTVEEIIKLKKAGVSDETIQMLIRQEQQKKGETKESSPNPYKTMGTWEVKDPDGKEATIYTTGSGEDQEKDQDRIEEENREKSWEMLRNLVIDERSGKQ
ncbi:MAG: hypothetical protein ABID54_15110 [Pseudomonadota bacterium]